MTKPERVPDFRRRAMRAVAMSLIAPVIAGSVTGIAIAAVLNL